MREELIKLLQERVGLDRQKAEQAVDTMLDYAKQHGPELTALLAGKGGLGGLFGR
jgi:hypothetical protein